MNELPIKVLLMGVIEKDDSILMRKKPAGSPPYKETWYSFGCEKDSNEKDGDALKKYLLNTVGIEVDSFESIGNDQEVKEDHDGITKQFIYLYYKCNYKNGLPIVPPGIERIEWIPKQDLHKYDIVPPSVKLFTQLGYL